MAEPTDTRNATRARVVDVAAHLLQSEGPAAVTTRAVAEGAGVQAPTIYRLFGDKDGLLEAVAEHVMAAHVSAKTAKEAAAVAAHSDPLDDLRTSWFAHRSTSAWPTRPCSGCSANRAGSSARPPRSRASSVLESPRAPGRGDRAAPGRRGSAPSGWSRRPGSGSSRCCCRRRPSSATSAWPDDLYDAVLAQILTDSPARPDVGPTATAVAFRAVTPALEALTAAERTLLVEWLDRVID